ncbi:MAG: hypothetical protein GTO22_21735, partial [Gemmatimonadales bacterium]|nr:hypothetical protein [Gemmatimonadales bacterium]
MPSIRLVDLAWSRYMYEFPVLVEPEEGGASVRNPVEVFGRHIDPDVDASGRVHDETFGVIPVRLEVV